MSKINWLNHSLAIVLFSLFALFLSQSNSYDWDHFFSFFEVELRSWLIDHRAPLWTYQLCAGVTRLGDPQAFGLSPLFLPVLFFGSYWGSKLMVFVCSLLGFIFLKRILHNIFAGPLESAEFLSLSFLFSNFYLWHIKVGHITFALIPLLFIPLYYFLLASKRALNTRESLFCFIGVFSYCTAGFYHSFVFFLLPLSLLILVFRPKLISRSFVICCLPAVLLSAYKWIPILTYQKEFPRKAALVQDWNSFDQILLNILAPTWQDKFLGYFDSKSNWMIYENSAFSILPMLLAILVFRRQLDLNWLKNWKFYLAILFVVFLSMGDSSPIPLHAWSNSYLFSQSVRVVSRYQYLLLFLLLLLVGHQYMKSSFKVQRFTRRTFGALLVLNFFSFLSWPQTWQLPIIEPEGKMRFLIPVKQRTDTESFMYPTVRAGGIVPNCYEPLGREMKIGHERWRSPKLPPLVNGLIPIISSDTQQISVQCIESAYVTQNELFFDPLSCPTDLCFHLNMLNIHNTKSLHWNEEKSLFCR